MEKIFYLMRHGETLFNVRKKIQGSCDSPLTNRGIHQAKVAARYFKGIDIDHAYSSSSERSCDTLELIIGDMPYKRLKGLKEMSFGVFEGESEDLNPKDRILFGTFFLGFGGESREMVQKRMVETCIDIMENENHNVVLAMSHAGACLQFLSAWQDPTVELKKGFGNCIIFKYAYENKVFKLIDVHRPDFEDLT